MFECLSQTILTTNREIPSLEVSDKLELLGSKDNQEDKKMRNISNNNIIAMNASVKILSKGSVITARNVKTTTFARTVSSSEIIHNTR